MLKLLSSDGLTEPSPVNGVEDKSVFVGSKLLKTFPQEVNGARWLCCFCGTELFSVKPDSVIYIIQFHTQPHAVCVCVYTDCLCRSDCVGARSGVNLVSLNKFLHHIYKNYNKGIHNITIT